MLAVSLILALGATADSSAVLASARRLSDSLRYEEAVVEYQRYLGGAADRPTKERAAALFELGFIHLVLGDEVNADQRAMQALELDSALSLPSSAPARQVDFLTELKRRFATRARVNLEQASAPEMVEATLVDPEHRVKRVVLRHALSANGPFYSANMSCTGQRCQAEIPAPAQGGSFTAWYFVEALDGKGATVAAAAGPDEPRQLAVVGARPWYQSPITWGAAGAALVAVGVVVYLLAPPPPR